MDLTNGNNAGDSPDDVTHATTSWASFLAQRLRRVSGTKSTSGPSRDLEASISLRRRYPKKSATIESTESIEITTFLATRSGNGSTRTGPLSPHQSTYIAYVKKEAEMSLEAFTELLKTNVTGTVSTNEVFVLLTAVTDCMNTKHHVSIDSIVRDLVKNNKIMSACAKGSAHAKAQSIVFVCIAWITMLYPPLPWIDAHPDQLNIDGRQAACLVTSQPIENCKRPICELMRDFGQLLPTKSEENTHTSNDSVFAANSLYVSLLNVATLARIGGVEIVWVNNISSHLVFDAEEKQLMIFCLPSFCEVNRFESTSLARILSDYYDEYDKPASFSSASYLKEIRLSYHLLFSDDSDARSVYQKKESRRAHQVCVPDPYLDKLCHHDARKATPTRSSYSAVTDFPILSGRLLVLQEYIQRQNPKTIAMLWRDKRDLLRWYTFWAVVIIGGLGILLTIVQIGLSATQVNLAMNPPQISINLTPTNVSRRQSDRV